MLPARIFPRPSPLPSRCRCSGTGMLAIIVAAVLALPGVWSPTVLAAPQDAATSARDVLRLLAVEARAVESEGVLRAEQPDFAQRHGLTVSERDRDLLARAVFAQQHSRSFNDAYIRWQLLSFNVELPAMDDRDFLRALRTLPDLLENPRAQAETVQLFERASQQTTVTERDRAMLREMFSTLQQQSEIVEHFNRPALGLRDWILKQVGERGVRPHLSRAERCAAIIAAGWPPAEIKGDITRAMAVARDDATITAPQRRDLAGVLSELAGRNRRFVSEVAFMADGSMNVRLSTAQVTNSDVRRWTDRLMGVERD